MKILNTASEITNIVKNNMSIMVGGFLGVGTPHAFVEAIATSSCNNLTLISSDTCYPDRGNGLLIINKKVSKLYVSHIGTNKETGNQYNEGTLDIEFVPQGTLAERIRAGGAGLGGVLTPTGIGTSVEENKQILSVDGKDYLVETALRADIALIKAYQSDEYGNLVFRKAMRNFNPIMVTAADAVCVEVDEIVDKLDPDAIHSPGVFVDYVCQVPRKSV